MAFLFPISTNNCGLQRRNYMSKNYCYLKNSAMQINISGACFSITTLLRLELSWRGGGMI